MMEGLPTLPFHAFIRLPIQQFDFICLTVSVPPPLSSCGLGQDGKPDHLMSQTFTVISLLTTNSLTCRQRKLKCDEQKPVCSQCLKASRECRPSDGIVFRHHQNASMNSASKKSGRESNLGGFYSYKNTFDKNSVWLEIPKQGPQLLCLFLNMPSDIS